MCSEKAREYPPLTDVGAVNREDDFLWLPQDSVSEEGTVLNYGEAVTRGKEGKWSTERRSRTAKKENKKAQKLADTGRKKGWNGRPLLLSGEKRKETGQPGETVIF